MAEQVQAPKGRVVALNVSQWKAVVLNDVTQLHQALANIVAPSDTDIANIEQFLGNTRNMLHGWKVAGAQLAAQQAAVAAQVEEPQAEVPAPPARATNGATPPKRKGGWPKGKKRNAPQHPAVAQ